MDRYSLSYGTRLNKRYRIEKVIGEGGFGITYFAWDEVLDMPVAIKEYYPSNIVGREKEGDRTNCVKAQSLRRQELYRKGRDTFLHEARMLSRYSHVEEIVTVRDYFRENETAYIVMEYIDGISIKEYIKKYGVFSYEKVLEMMKPVLEALQIFHGSGLIHRDLSPDNIIITQDGKLKLIDFGAVRYVDAEAQKTMTVMFKCGFAALEQYQTKGQQGVWTDVYGICATMYYMMVGKIPEEAVSRVLKDTLVKLKDIPEINVLESLSDAISKGMEVQKENRYKDIAALYMDLYGEPLLEKKVVFLSSDMRENNIAEEKSVADAQKDKEEEGSKTEKIETEVFYKEMLAEKSKRQNMRRKRNVYVGTAIILLTLFVSLAAGIIKDKNKLSSRKVERREAVATLQEVTSTPVVSEKEEETDMPDVKGVTIKKAKKILYSLGVEKISVRYVYHNKIKKDSVIRQSVSVGESLPKELSLILSKGKKEKKSQKVSAFPVVTSQPENTPDINKPAANRPIGKEEAVAGTLDDRKENKETVAGSLD